LIQEKGKSQTQLLYLLHKIDSLENLGEYDPTILEVYISNTEQFCSIYPEDPTYAEYIYQAGLLAMTLAKSSDI
jgi:hypothetical protein